MIQWMNPGTRRACLFVALLAALAGCNDGGDKAQTPQETTFAIAEAVDDTKVPEVPVVGIVTEVPDTDPKPLLEERLPDPLAIDLPNEDIKMPITRFLETAPDTIEGAIFESSATFQYDLGNLVARFSSDSASFTGGRTFVSPTQGWIRYPKTALDPANSTEKYPVIVFLHGQHTDSATEHSYQGYNYLAEDLTPHGYVVLSIDASVINEGGGDNQSSLPRAQLVLGTFDRLRQINENGQVDRDGKPGPLDALKGKLDFSRIGLMGHSRGGQGVSNTILFNQSRSGVTMQDLRAALMASSSSFKTYYPDLAAAYISSTSLDETKFNAALQKYNVYFAAGSGNADVPPPYDFKGAFLLAQTDFGGNSGLSDVPMVTLLPSCDGDMRNLQGASTFDRNRFGRPQDVAPRYQIMVNGANHNYYNTHWPTDDFSSGRGPDYCLPAPRADTIRLSPENQRRGGMFIINSFMRYHVGGEQRFASWWNGLAGLPDAACSDGKGPCDERVLLTAQENGETSAVIQRFEWGDSLRRNLLGGAMAFSGFDATARCNTPSAASTGGNCTPTRLPGFEYQYALGSPATKGLLSIADHAELAWSKPNASIITDLKGLSGKGFDSLTFRIAVVWPMGQEVYVTLTDDTSKQATVTASNFSDALYNAPRKKAGGDVKPEDDLPLKDAAVDSPYSSGQVKMLMNMVAIPLRAFEGIDTTSLKELKLTFPKASGKVAIADIQLQNFGRDKRACELAMPKPSWCPDAPKIAGNTPPQTAQSEKEDKDKLLLISQ
jgi:hypothetical protein